MHHLWRDIRYSIRSLARTPAVAVTIVLTVGIALGATAAMVGIVRAVLVNPLPYADPGSLVWIYTDNSALSLPLLGRGLPRARAGSSDLQRRRGVSDHAASRSATRGVAERVTAKAVTGSYFPLLGQRPHLGRLFDPSDDARGEPEAVLTYAYWARRFGEDPTAVGRTITIDGASYAIVGVLQRSVGPLEHDVALFTAAHWPPPKRKGPFFTTVLAPPQAGRLARRGGRGAAMPPTRGSSRSGGRPTRTRRRRGVCRTSKRASSATSGSTLMFVLAAVGCVLLIACANAVNLLVARALGRSRELAIRGALGASRGRLLQHLFAETARADGWRRAGRRSPSPQPRSSSSRTTAPATFPRIDESPAVCAGPRAWLAALAVGERLRHRACPGAPQLAPAHGSRARARADGRRATGRPRGGSGASLVAAEFALATPLLVAGALVLQSLNRLSHVPCRHRHGARADRAASRCAGRAMRARRDRQAFWKRAAGAAGGAARRRGASALADSRPPGEAGQTEQLRSRRSSDAGRPEPAGLSPGWARRLTSSRRSGSRSSAAAASTSAIDCRRRRRRRRPRVGRSLLPRPGTSSAAGFTSGGCTSCPWTTVVGVVGTVKWRGPRRDRRRARSTSPFVDLPNALPRPSHRRRSRAVAPRCCARPCSDSIPACRSRMSRPATSSSPTRSPRRAISAC